MFNTIFNELSNIMEIFGSSVSSNTIIIAGICIILISTVLAITYKIASYDYDVFYTASRTMSFIRKPREKRVGGSLNYYMRCFPKEIGKQWDRFYKTREGKPSEYFTMAKHNSSGVMDSVAILAVRAVVIIVLAISCFYALGQKNPTFQSVFATLFLPVVIGILSLLGVNFGFSLINIFAESKFQDLLHLLDFYSLSGFDGYLPPVRKKIVEDKKPISTLSRFEMERVDDLEGISAFKKKIAETAQSSSELETLAVKLSMEKLKTESVHSEEKLNSAINDLMTTLAMQDKSEDESAKIAPSKIIDENYSFAENTSPTEIPEISGNVVYMYNKASDAEKAIHAETHDKLEATQIESAEFAFPGAIKI